MEVSAYQPVLQAGLTNTVFTLTQSVDLDKALEKFSDSDFLSDNLVAAAGSDGHFRPTSYVPCKDTCFSCLKTVLPSINLLARAAFYAIITEKNKD